MNWGWFLLRIALAAGILTLVFLSQRFWYRGLWRVTGNWRSQPLRVAVRLAGLCVLALSVLAIIDGVRMGRHHLIARGTIFPSSVALWFTSTIFGYFTVKLIRGLDRGWNFLRRKSIPASAVLEAVADPGRRYLFKTATAAAGAGPFFCAMYGFAAERLNYQIRRVEIPVANLPGALDGLKIVQLSDIHLSGYMPREQVRRAVDMANELGGDLAVVTGDFITGAGDPLADCVEEIRRLAAPLGIYGCNGNHEIYAKAEDAAQALFAQAGMKLLRHQNAQLTFRGAPLNLIGVDYQRERSPKGRRIQTLAGVEPLVRRDMPNILLSHNPNSFHRAAELGIELSLAGHTHGGQVQVEILDHRLSPARFFTDYIAGLYQRPLFLSSSAERFSSSPESAGRKEEAARGYSSLYVNRGLGTVGAPVRLGVPPEISLLTLRRA